MKNDYEVRGEVTAIFMKRKGKKQEAIIDTEDLTKVQSFPNTWFPYYSADIDDYYAVGRMIVGGIAQHLRMHRLIMDTPVNMVVDHLNHKTLDNRRSINLRNVTDDQNKQNRSHKNGIRGVKWDERISKWCVTVTVNKETMNFGYFESKDEAIDVSKRARAKYHPFSLEANEIISGNDIQPFQRKKARKISGVKGVTWHQYSERWRTRVNINGKMTVIGAHEDLEDAIEILKEYRNKIPS